jgi:hypothetical protein
MTNQRQLMAYLLVACLPLLVASCCSTVPSTITQAPVVKPKSASQAALHVIGVYQGQLPETVDKRPWWAQCQAMNEAAGKLEPSAVNACHALLNPGRDQRTITVNVSDETTPIILGLMAYEGVTWQINTTPGVVIEKVILAGYHQQRIQGVGDAQVDVYSYDNSPCDRCVQKGRYFYAYERVPFEMEVAAGMRASSFQGNYTGGTYQIFKGMQ